MNLNLMRVKTVTKHVCTKYTLKISKTYKHVHVKIF